MAVGAYRMRPLGPHCLVNRKSPCRCNYSAASNNMKLVHWPLMGGLLHLVQWGADGRGHSPSRPLLAVPNVTTHPSTAGKIAVLLYNRPLLNLLCGFKPLSIPTEGPIFDRRQQARLQYCKRFRQGKRFNDEMYTNELHDALLRKDGPSFWKCWRSKF